tara:strand:- start:202 stop:870 length:669 start_codon:yes stop_codon:yes gene_type:complete
MSYEKQLKNMDKADIRFICRELGIIGNLNTKTRQQMITNILKPLKPKYKMNKTDVLMKDKIMSFLPNRDAANFLINKENRRNFQRSIDKRARKRMNKIIKWNSLFSNEESSSIFHHTIREGLERTNFKDIGELFYLSRRGLLKYPLDEVQYKNFIYYQLKIAVEENNNTESVKNILKDKYEIWFNDRYSIQYIMNNLLRIGKSDNIKMYKILLENGADTNQE